MTRDRELLSESDLQDLLKNVLRVAGLSAREVERRGGPSHVTVSRMLRGGRLRTVRAYVAAIEAAGYQLRVCSRSDTPAGDDTP